MSTKPSVAVKLTVDDFARLMKTRAAMQAQYPNVHVTTSDALRFAVRGLPADPTISAAYTTPVDAERVLDLVE